MSRCILDNEARNIEVVIGWDAGSKSFFAHVFDNAAARRARDAGASRDEIEAAGLVLRTGGYDRSYHRPDELIAAIKPYATDFTTPWLREELLRDQMTDDCERIYDPSHQQSGGLT